MQSISSTTGTIISSSLLCTALCLTASCADNPVYIQPAEALEAGTEDEDPDNPGTSTQIVLPIRLETDKEAADRAALSAELGIEIPFVKLRDLDLSLEWTIRNLADTDANIVIGLNGANELFEYVPAGFVVDPEEDEEPPSLAGGIPLIIPALGTRTGVFREDDIREVSVDLELITRGGINPFAAILTNNEDITEFTGEIGVVPFNVFASMIRFDLTLVSSQHVVMEYAVRIRSNRSPSLVHDEGLFAIVDELTAFAPETFVPPPPEEE